MRRMYRPLAEFIYTKLGCMQASSKRLSKYFTRTTKNTCQKSEMLTVWRVKFLCTKNTSKMARFGGVSKFACFAVVTPNRIMALR